jgi:hypothetical protein
MWPDNVTEVLQIDSVPEIFSSREIQMMGMPLEALPAYPIAIRINPGNHGNLQFPFGRGTPCARHYVSD